MIVTVSGRSGLRNAYVSVLSAEGSSEINGASRWLDACAAVGLPPRDASAATSAAVAPAATRTNASFRIVRSLLSDGRLGCADGRRNGPDSPAVVDRFGIAAPHARRSDSRDEPDCARARISSMSETPRRVPRSFAHL